MTGKPEKRNIKRQILRFTTVVKTIVFNITAAAGVLGGM
jgi:hypothetical protein